MSEGRRLIKNTFIIAVGSISTKLITFLLLPFYTVYLTTSEYGIYDYIVTFATCFIPVMTLLVDESIFRFLIDCKTHEEKKQVISISILIEFVGILSFTVLLLSVGVLLKIDYLGYIICYLLSCCLSSVINPIMRGEGRYVPYTLYNAAVSFGLTLLSLLFVMVFSMGIVGLLLANTISHVVISVVFATYLKIWKYFDFRSCSWRNAKEILKYSVPLIPNKLSWSIMLLSDRFLIMQFIGSPAAGIYAVSGKFPTIVSTVYGFFGTSWQESAARVLHKESTEFFYNSAYIKMKKLLYSAVLLLCAIMPLFFYFFIGENFMEAIYYVPILVLATYYGNLSVFLGGILSAYKNTKVMGYTTVYAALVNIIINLTLIHFIGLYASALSSLAANYLMYRLRKSKVQEYVRLVEKKGYSITCLIIGILVFFCFYQRSIFFDIAGAACAIAFFCASVYQTGLHKYIIRIKK